MNHTNTTTTIPPVGPTSNVAKFVQMLALTSVETTLTLILQILVGIILSHPKVNLLPKSLVKGVAGILVNALLPIFVCVKLGTAIDFSMMGQIIAAPVGGFALCFFQFFLGLLLFADCGRCLGCFLSQCCPSYYDRNGDPNKLFWNWFLSVFCCGRGQKPIEGRLDMMNEDYFVDEPISPVEEGEELGDFAAPYAVEVDDVGFFGADEEGQEVEREEDDETHPLVEVKPEAATMPRHMLIMAIQFNNFLIIPYAYLIAFTNANVFVDSEREKHVVLFLSMFYFPIIVLFFSFGAWYASIDPVAKENADKKAVLDEKMSEKMEEREEAFLELGRRPGELGWVPADEEEDVPVPCWKRVFCLPFNVLKGCCGCVCLPEGKCDCLRKVLIGIRNIVSLLLLKPTIIGMLIGVFIGLIPALKGFIFINPPPVLQAFSKMMNMFSASTIPLFLLVTGANIGSMLFAGQVPQPLGTENSPPMNSAKYEALHERLAKNPDESMQEGMYVVERDFRMQHGPMSKVQKEQHDREEEKRKEAEAKIGICRRIITLLAPKTVSCWTLIRVVGAKLVLSPVLVFAFCVFLSMVKPDLVMKEVALRPLMYLTIVIEASCPVTLTLGMYAALNGVGVKELSECMLWQYFVFPFTMVPLCVIYLFYFCYVDADACYSF